VIAQTEWLTEYRGALLVERGYRFERLTQDFADFAKRCVLSVQLPHLKASKKVSYREYYDANSKAIVSERFAQDLTAFGYRF